MYTQLYTYNTAQWNWIWIASIPTIPKHFVSMQRSVYDSSERSSKKKQNMFHSSAVAWHSGIAKICNKICVDFASNWIAREMNVLLVSAKLARQDDIWKHKIRRKINGINYLFMPFVKCIRRECVLHTAHCTQRINRRRWTIVFISQIN